MTINLPGPPRPEEFSADPARFMESLCRWLSVTRGEIERESRAIQSEPAIGSGHLLGNAAEISAVAIDTTLTALIDRALGSTQGNVLYRGATAWTVLAPGTSGQVLKTQGAAANPAWVSGTGSGLAFSTVAQVQSASAAVVSGTLTLTLGATPIVGNLLVFMTGGYLGSVIAPAKVYPLSGGLHLNTTGSAASGTLAPMWADGEQQFGGASNQSLRVWTKVVESGDGTSYAFTNNAGRYAGVVIEVSGVGNIKASASMTFNAAGTTATDIAPPLACPDFPGAVLWAFYCQDASSNHSTPTGWVEQFLLNSASHEVRYVKKTATIGPGNLTQPTFSLTSIATTGQPILCAYVLLEAYSTFL